MKAVLEEELDNVIEKTRVWNLNSYGLGLPGETVNEMIHHCRIQEDKCRTFKERQITQRPCRNVR
jgi:hypothetical protein